jgi:UTP:GlnB (protein PII) uridylyltransferase
MFPQQIQIPADIIYITVMPNRNLSADELKLANELLKEIRQKLTKLSEGDSLLLFAFRRKIAKELGYDERGKPMARRQLKALKWAQQHMKCAHCNEQMPLEYSELDRKFAPDGYTPENTDLVHAKCHQARQAAKRYT